MNEQIIKDWNIIINEPEKVISTVMFEKEILQNVFDDSIDPFFRTISQISTQSNRYRKIGQLLTNRKIEELSQTELTVALSSLGLNSNGLKHELVIRLKSYLNEQNTL